MRTRSVLVVPLTAILVLILVTPALAVTPTPLLESAAHTYQPGITADHLVWTQYASGNWSVMARLRSGGTAWRLNASRTQGYSVETIEGTDTAVYQQFTRSTSDIYLYDLSARTRTRLGGKVNTSAWEYWPTASVKYVMFMRITSRARVLMLWNRQTNAIRQLASVGLKCGGCLSPEWVGQGYAIYTQWSADGASGRTRIWKAGAGTTTLPDQAAPYQQVGAAMDEATGDIYYAFTTKECGLFAEIRRWNVGGGSPTTIYDFPEGIDVSTVSLGPSLTTPSDIDLVFDDWDCLYDDPDVYAIESVNTIT